MGLRLPKAETERRRLLCQGDPGYAKKLGHYYPEVTYNRDANELYVDIYLKQSNTKIPAEEFDFEAE